MNTNYFVSLFLVLSNLCLLQNTGYALQESLNLSILAAEATHVDQANARNHLASK